MSAPRLEMIEGDLHADGWGSARPVFRVEPETFDRVIRVAVRNPTQSAIHLRNQVRVEFDGEPVFDDVLFPGAGVTLERTLDAKDDLLVEVVCEAVMEPDALDPRERGVFVKVTHAKVEAAPSKPAAKLQPKTAAKPKAKR